MIGILHNIRSLHNVGSIFRTADGAGIEKLYLCGYTPAPLNKFELPDKRLSKTALGAEEYVEWEKVGQMTDLSSTATLKLFERLKKNEFTIYAVEQSNDSLDYSSLNLSEDMLNKTAIVVGPEVEGLPDDILQAVDHILEIPMYGKKNSLNVSVAFGIIAYALKKQ